MRSSVLSDLQHVKASVDAPPMQRYRLDGRKPHQYHSLDDVLINGKDEGNQYYQLNSKKHHPYRPDPKLFHQEPNPGRHGRTRAVSIELEKVLDGGNGEPKLSTESTGPENGINSKLKIVKNKNKNGRIVIVMSKYMENGKQVDGGTKQNEPPERGTNYANCTVETAKQSERNGLENGYHEDDKNTPLNCSGFKEIQNSEISQLLNISGPNSAGNSTHKRRHSEPSSNRRDTRSFLSCRSISAPNASPIRGLNGHAGVTSDASDSFQDEPMDLSFTGSRGSRKANTGWRPNGCSNPAEKEATDLTRESEDAPSFAPFLGNIIITDVTTNCLTVTFKEYVPVQT